MPNTSLRPARSSRAARTLGKGAWVESRRGGLRVLQVRALKTLPWLLHGFSTRPGGVSLLEGERVLNLGFTDWDTREHVQSNRERFLAAISAAKLPLVTLRQIHSDVVHVFDAAPLKKNHCGDALVARVSGLLLAVQTADCVPILLVDPKRRAVAAVHAGWRGTLQRIAEKTVGQLQMSFGARPSDLVAALGPAIGGCCYEVGTELAHAFSAQFDRAADWFDELRTGDEPNPLQWLSMSPPGHNPPPKKVRLDLRAANRRQLLDAGLAEKNILVSGLCTACRRELFFSYRREGAQTGRLLSVIGIRDGI